MAKGLRRPTDGNLGFDPYLYISPETNEIRHLIERSVPNTYRLFSGTKNRVIAHYLADAKPVLAPKDVEEYVAHKVAMGWSDTIVRKHVEAIRNPASYSLMNKKGLAILRALPAGKKDDSQQATSTDLVVDALYKGLAAIQWPGANSISSTLMTVVPTLGKDTDIFTNFMTYYTKLKEFEKAMNTAKNKVGDDKWQEAFDALNLPKGTFIGWLNGPEGTEAVERCYISFTLADKTTKVVVPLPQLSAVASGWVFTVQIGDNTALSWNNGTYPLVSPAGTLGKMFLGVQLKRSTKPEVLAVGTELVGGYPANYLTLAHWLMAVKLSGSPALTGTVPVATQSMFTESAAILAGDVTGYAPVMMGENARFPMGTEKPSTPVGSSDVLPSRGFIFTLAEGFSYYELAIVGMSKRTVLGVSAFAGSHLYQAGKMSLAAMADHLQWQLSALKVTDAERTNAMRNIEQLRAAKGGVCTMVWYAEKQKLPYDPLQYVPAEVFAKRAEQSLANEVVYDGIDMTWGKAANAVNEIRSSDEFLILSEQELNKHGMIDPLLSGTPGTHVLVFDKGPKGPECTLGLKSGGLVGQPMDIEDIRCYTQAGYPWTYGLAYSSLEKPRDAVMAAVFPGEKWEDMIVNDPLTGKPVEPGGALEYRMDIARLYENDFLFYHKVPEADRPLVAILTQGIAQTKEPRAVMRSSLLGNYAAAMVPLHLYDDIDVPGGDLSVLG